MKEAVSRFMNNLVDSEILGWVLVTLPISLVAIVNVIDIIAPAPVVVLSRVEKILSTVFWVPVLSLSVLLGVTILKGKPVLIAIPRD